ncbi:MAG TPA: GTP cyclohydrolase FolE2 [Treponemataceae bacterium]|nr:GTP cyclohydrolase FolE2 [Treponemataceae bacterium]
MYASKGWGGSMIDMQNEKDERAVPLQKVGVKGVQYPIRVLDKKNNTQETIGTANLFVNLPHHFKGTHMSRFIEVFHQYRGDLSMRRFLAMLEEIRVNLEAERAFGRVRFPFFIEKKAPVSLQKGMMCYHCSYEGAAWQAEENEKTQPQSFFITVKVPVTTLCPCSKAISNYGAHNQRGIVRVKVKYSSFFWIEDIVSLIEKSASSPVYSVLKRSDEKFVTEQAYDNPRFVEDLVREIYLGLKNFAIEKPFKWFSIEAENFESIHNHSAYAYAEYEY